MRGAMRFNVHERSVAAPMMAAAAQQSHYDQNNHQQQMHNGSHQAPHSPWRSPVPYLFGGLAAMLGLIAFALLILACSYWKLSGYLEGSEGGGRDGDVESGQQQEGQKAASSEKVATAQVYEQKIVVIMAGDQKPTYLATPMASRNNSFGDEGKADNSGKAGVEDAVARSGGSEERKVEGGGDTAGQEAGDTSKGAESSEGMQEGTDDSTATSGQDERTWQ